ncbi:MAG: transglycosylase SLT domain-containing protein [Chitinivibrionales bacterium]|nr:transglycosylase SLT domain-containing protein [Chitinivibrionales bacterium]
MRTTPRTAFAVVVPILCLAAQYCRAQTDPFAVPEILKPNVAFWTKIYTEVSLTEGLFHDREYPLIIYRKETVGKRSGRSRRAFLRKHEAQIVAQLNNIATKPVAQLTSEEKRIKGLFATYAPDDFSTAAQRIRFQQGQKERFMEGIERSGMYLDTIRAILRSYDVPLRLAYLPHVESSFDYSAYSKVGAAGMWQFMRGTGRQYGLKVDYLVDQRRDPILSSDAAARLLAYNYSKLKAWPLAITAYNHGLSGMMRAVAKTGSSDIAVIVQRHSSRTFRFASKNFYSCFLAASEIAENPQNYFDVVSYHDRMGWHDITLTHYVRPNVLAQYLNVSERALQRLNPALRSVVFAHDKLIPQGYVLHLPADITSKQALAALAAIPDSLRSDKPERPQYYRVRRGDNLYSIAYRMGVSARDIALENNITRMNRIYAGQVLRIPGATARPATPAVAVAAKPKPSPPKKPAKPAEKPLPAPVPVPVAIDTLEVAAADTLPVTETDTMSDSLREIIMATADTLTPSSPTMRPSRMTRFDADMYNLETTLVSPSVAEIRVAVDETIGHYADWLGIPTWRIRRANTMGRRSGIRVGQRVAIPLDRDDALEHFAKTRLEYHMMLEEDFYSRFKIADVKPKRVRRGENLWDICSAEGEIPLWLFKKHNRHIDLSRLYPGMLVWLPVVEEKTEEDLALEQLDDGGIYPAYYEPVGARPGTVQLLP